MRLDLAKIMLAKFLLKKSLKSQRRNTDFSMWEKCEQMKLQERTIKMIKGVNEMINGQRLKDRIHLIYWKD